MDSLGIYISVPFCRSKCTYCNFASDVHSTANHQLYVERVCRDIRSVREDASLWRAVVPQQVDSVYLGGGTPSVLGPVLMGQLWQALRQEFDISKSAEITLECAPGQLDSALLETMLECGLNRVSFGVQSFVDREAAVTGRLHTREIALADLQRVRSAGVDRINIDLIAGLPYQNQASWQDSLATLCDTVVDHASVYILEIDEDSRLGGELLAGGSRYHAAAVPSEELTADLYEMAIAELADHGLEQYEISNFARPGCQSRHNERYWRRRPYLGFGLDAHSQLQRQGTTGLRWETAAMLEEYLGRSPLVPLEASGRSGEVSHRTVCPERPVSALAVRELSHEEEIEEAWFLGLRLREGVQWSALREQFAAESLDRYIPVVDELCELALLVQERGRVRLTRRGMLFSNEVFSRFIGVDQVRPLVETARTAQELGK